MSSSCDVFLPAPVPTSSVRHQVNQVCNSGPSLDGFKSILDDFRQCISSDLASFSTRMSVLENNANRSSSSVISHPQVQDHESEQEDSDEDERLSVASGSQEGEFSFGEEAETPVQVSQNVSQPSVPVSLLLKLVSLLPILVRPLWLRILLLC